MPRCACKWRYDRPADRRRHELLAGPPTTPPRYSASPCRLGHPVVGDRPADIAATLGHRAGRGRLIYGGLGSTADDLTRERSPPGPACPWTWTTASPPSWRKGPPARVCRLCGTFKQAQVPRGLAPMRNPVGSAGSRG
jgi:hypothetical protein